MQEFSIGASGREIIFIVLHDWAEETHTNTVSVNSWPCGFGAQIGPRTYWDLTHTVVHTQRERTRMNKRDSWSFVWITDPCAVTRDASRASESYLDIAAGRIRLTLSNMSVRIYRISSSLPHTPSTHSCLSGARLWSRRQRSRQSISAACPPACTDVSKRLHLCQLLQQTVTLLWGINTNVWAQREAGVIPYWRRSVMDVLFVSSP